jgi:hypothetical protein
MIDPRLIEHARKVRDAIDQYNYFWRGGGACGLASLELFKFARRHRINLTFAGNRTWHCFNIYKDYIIDQTATQFNDTLDKVAIVPLKEAKTKYWWTIEFQARTLKEFACLDKTELEFEHKWFYQNPYLYEFVEDRNRLILRKK